MKKILYVVDYLQNEPNSVSSILKNILDLEVNDYQQIIALHQGNQNATFTVQKIEEIKTYSAKQYSSFTKKLLRIRTKVLGNKNPIQCNKEHIRKIMKKECPDLVIFFLYNPESEYVKNCENMNVPYIYILYDTYVGRPKLICNVKTSKSKELHVINNSIAYFVPSFFYNEYLDCYNNKKIIPFDLPLLIDKQLINNAFESDVSNYNFTYFGQLQSFRNSEKIKSIFNELDLVLDIFTQSSIESDDIFVVHTPIKEH